MEYRLKSCLPNSEHHVMILPSNISLLDLAPNLCMYRDASLAPSQELEPMEQESLEPGVSIAPFGLNASKSKAKAFKKKSQVVQIEEEDETRLREEETAPWVLEDEEQRAFLGRLEGGQESNYVLFVNQGTEFCVIPASKWYKFLPKIQYSTLSLEEAEAKMTSRKKTIDDRWMMHKKLENPDEEVSKAVPRRRPHSNESMDVGDEVDFEEVFDDDEGLDNNSAADDEEVANYLIAAER
jgi:transcription initiation factor TFIIF subunit alpha